MKGIASTLLLVLVFSWTNSSFGQTSIPEEIAYISPKPNSSLHLPQTRLVFRPQEEFVLDSPEVCMQEIVITGPVSGNHEFDVHLSMDGRTVNIIPRIPFEYGEQINVEIGDIFELDSGAIPAFSWTFSIAPEIDRSLTSKIDPEVLTTSDERTFPTLTTLVEPQPGLYEGNIFMELKMTGAIDVGILDFQANSPELWSYTSAGQGEDFRLNRNGLVTMFNAVTERFELWGPQVELIRDFSMVNGYTIDEHDFQILPDGHYFLFAYDLQPVDMSLVVPNGNPNAMVEGFVIQELDYDDNLIMQWRSWDYLEITDNEDSNLNAAIIGAFHINSLEVDTDENIIISCRHTNEVLKYNRQTGDIIWRWTINSYGDFSFLNDNGFSYQHDCRRLDNGNLLLFDNANLTTQISRAVEYSMDTLNGKVTKVWQFHHPENLFGSSRGSARRLPNGNTIICWGSVAIDAYGARFSEVSPGQSTTLFEFAASIEYSSYRITKSNWAFGNWTGGCGDESAPNYDSAADYWLPDFCQLDNDGDGFSVEMGDCNDSDITIYPGAPEIPDDGIDQDCSGLDWITGAQDDDGDGYSPDDGDCNDNDATVYPGAEEIPYDGIDQDCDGMDLTDVDGDGFSPDDGDCDDGDATIYPGADEIPYDGIDQDCDGMDLTDVDGDGFSPDDGDCDDGDASIYPGAEEILNDGIDQDCDGVDQTVGVEESQVIPFQVYLGEQNTLVVVWNLNHKAELSVYDMRSRLLLQQELIPGKNFMYFEDYSGPAVMVIESSEGGGRWSEKVVLK